MAIEQAPAAATPIEAAPLVDAENVSSQDSELALASLLEKMSAPAPVEAAGEEEVADPVEPAADEPEPDSSLTAEPDEVDSADAGADGESNPGDENKNPNARNFRGRWDHLNEQERRVIELTTKRGLSLQEAYWAVYGNAAPEKRQAEAVIDPVAAVEAEIERTQSAIAGIENRIAEVPFDPATHRGMAKELAEATRKLVRLETEKEEASGSRSSRVQAPTRAAASSPAVPNVPSARSTGSEPSAPAPKRTARPVATGGSVPPNPSFDQQTRQALASNNTEALLAAMREGGTKFEDLLRQSA